MLPSAKDERHLKNCKFIYTKISFIHSNQLQLLHSFIAIIKFTLRNYRNLVFNNILLLHYISAFSAGNMYLYILRLYMISNNFDENLYLRLCSQTELIDTTMFVPT
ncbi:hypothetical protein NIES2100_77230 [Calothrix sp. NIES-2100]|nr:hypothetical protein NIES2100_77230 [Calothrix sp. NIES-2100]